MNKILHIIEGFNGQAIERWLYWMVRHFDEAECRFDWTFYATLGLPGEMDSAIRELGGRIVYSPAPLRETAEFVKALRAELSRGAYDILHSHHDVMSSVYLMASAGLPLKKRIVHIHNTSLSLPTPSPLKQVLLREPMRRACLHLADHVVGVSSAALDAFLMGRRRKPGRDRVIHCGIDMHPFSRDFPGRAAVLRSIGLAEDAKVLLFVGRMIEYKNPCFVIEILFRLSKAMPHAAAVFAGTGPFEESVKRMAERMSLAERVRVLGWRGDVPELMRSCDLLVWPGLEEPKEGLGLGVVEAQAAGLPVLMSLSVPPDAVVVPQLVDILPLSAGADAWAAKSIEILNRPCPDKAESFAKVSESSFSISRSAENILALHYE